MKEGRERRKVEGREDKRKRLLCAIHSLFVKWFIDQIKVNV
jgi:hypothetical protein